MTTEKTTGELFEGTSAIAMMMLAVTKRVEDLAVTCAVLRRENKALATREKIHEEKFSEFSASVSALKEEGIEREAFWQGCMGGISKDLDSAREEIKRLTRQNKHWADVLKKQLPDPATETVHDGALPPRSSAESSKRKAHHSEGEVWRGALRELYMITEGKDAKPQKKVYDAEGQLEILHLACQEIGHLRSDIEDASEDIRQALIDTNTTPELIADMSFAGLVAEITSEVSAAVNLCNGSRDRRQEMREQINEATSLLIRVFQADLFRRSSYTSYSFGASTPDYAAINHLHRDVEAFIKAREVEITTGIEQETPEQS